MTWYGGANNTKGQLSGTLAIGGSSFTLKSGHTFPETLANVVVTIENEMILGSYASGTFTISSRGFSGTSAAAHAADTWVYVNSIWEHISQLQTAIGDSGGIPVPTAENDFLVGNPSPFGAWVKKTLAQVKTILGLGTAAYTASTDYATAAQANATHTGDVTGATALTIAAKAVTLAKMNDLAQDKIIGRATASTGVPEVIDCTAAARALLDDANAAAQLVTLGAMPIAGGTLTGAAVAADHGTAATAQVPNLCYGTGSPPTASTTPEGTIFIKYAA